MVSKQIDNKETARVVTLFLKDDFQNLLDTAGLHRITRLSSPAMSGMPPAHSNANVQEKKVVTGLEEAQRASLGCDAIFATIQDLTQTEEKPYRKVTEDIFLRGYTIDRTGMSISRAPRTVNKLKQKAMVEFSRRFNFWKVKFHRDDLPDLRRWVK